MKISPLFLASILILILSLANKTTSWKEKNPKNLNSPFECGFNNMSKLQTPLSNNFFMFNVLFLILELEIIIIIPFTFLKSKSNLSYSPFFIVMMMILITMMMEWKNKMLEWSK